MKKKRRRVLIGFMASPLVNNTVRMWLLQRNGPQPPPHMNNSNDNNDNSEDILRFNFPTPPLITPLAPIPFRPYPPPPFGPLPLPTYPLTHPTPFHNGFMPTINPIIHYSLMSRNFNNNNNSNHSNDGGLIFSGTGNGTSAFTPVNVNGLLEHHRINQLASGYTSPDHLLNGNGCTGPLFPPINHSTPTRIDRPKAESDQMTSSLSSSSTLLAHLKVAAATADQSNSSARSSPIAVTCPIMNNNGGAGANLTLIGGQSAANGDRSLVGSSYDGSSPAPTSPSSNTSSPSNSNSPSSIPLPANSNAKCLICEDNASGFHYGVVSCEGCKGFFRRTVQKGIQYHCHKEGACPVTRTTRNRCQCCRFKKCLNSGMSKESVRQDRNRKRKHKEDDSEVQISNIYQQIIKTVVSAHRRTSEMMKNIHENYRIAELCTSHTFDDSVVCKIKPFAQQIPGFDALSSQTGEFLWRSAAVEIVALRCAYAESVSKNDYDSNNEISTKQQHPPQPNTLPSSLFSFRAAVKKLARSFKQLNICEEEIALISAICLMSSKARVDPCDQEAIEKAQDTLLKALYIQIGLRRCEKPLITFAKLLMKLSDVQALSIADPISTVPTHLLAAMPAETASKNCTIMKSTNFLASK